MASGRMEYHFQSIMAHANFCYVLPVDVEMPEVRDKSYYDRPTKSLILLHGLTGTDTDWLYGGVAQEMAVQYNLAVFMPTTGNSFYLNRGYVGGEYTTYIGEEFPEVIRKIFGYCTDRENTLIGGLSMGGYGATHVALAHPEAFSSCIAMSSAYVIDEIGRTGGRSDGTISQEMLRDIFGDFDTILDSDRNPKAQIKALKEAGIEIPKMYVACGTEDTLLDKNRDFARFLESENVDHIYEEGPGGHNWTFWNEYLDRGLKALL